MKKRETYLLSFLLLSVFLYFFSPPILLSLTGFLGKITNPIRANLYSLTIPKNQTVQVKKLEEENRKLKELLLEFENIKKDNEALRSQFQEAFIPPTTLIPAKVVGFRGKYVRPTSLLIDQGKKSGIKKNAAVVVGKNLIGKIGNISSYNAEVILVNSPEFSTLVYDTQTNAPGIISGQEDFLLLENVVITDEINEGDQILTKGEIFENGAIIPEGLLVGSVKEVQKLETRPFQTGVVLQNIVSNKLLTVFVVIE